MTILAGGLADAGDFVPGVGIGLTLYIPKGASESVTNSTTLQDDDALTFTLVAGRRYLVEFCLSVQGPTAGDFKTAWSVPVDATGIKDAVGPANTGSAGFVGRDDTNGRFSYHGFTTVVGYHIDTLGTSIREKGWVESATGGTLVLQWAQQTANATATQINSQSYLLITRVT